MPLTGFLSLLLVMLMASMLYFFLELGYCLIRFPEHVRRAHPETYRHLMHDWEGPAFVYRTGEMGAFIWRSDDDLGDPSIARYRVRIRRALRCLVILAALFVLVGFPLVVATQLWR
jgi:hypothetical protein